LTQNTNWQNVNKAMGNLERAKKCSLKLILALALPKLAALIRPSGFYKTKAKYLQGVAKYVLENGGAGKLMKQEPLELRAELLRLKGVGPETADSILLYGLDLPVFVIDEYTRRLVKGRRIASNLNYEYLRKLFETNLPKRFELYQDLHALIVEEGKDRKLVIRN